MEHELAEMLYDMSSLDSLALLLVATNRPDFSRDRRQSTLDSLQPASAMPTSIEGSGGSQLRQCDAD